MYSNLMRLVALTALCAFALPVRSQTADVPYWASLRADKVNMRVGPSEEYRIAWVYKRKLLPVKVVRLKDGWRLVEDPNGTKGWMLSRFLSRERGAIVRGQGLAAMRESGNPESGLRWQLRPGVSGKLGECSGGWCEFDVGGRKGWVEQHRLWGAGEP